MQEIIRGLTSGPIPERIVTFIFLMASFGVFYYGLVGLLRIARKGKVGPVEFDTTAPIPQRPGDPPPAPVVLAGERRSILEHKLFQAEAEIMNMIRGLDDGTNKGAVAVAFLKDCKFESVYRHMRKFAKNIESSRGAQLKNFPIVLNHIMQDYAETARSVEFRIGTRVLCGVPGSWNRKFDKWHNPHIDMLLKGIREILSDDYYYDWWSTATACFDLLHVVLVLTLEDAKQALLEINGELDREIEAMLCRD